MVVISTSKGDIHLQLDTENTPATAENFLNYVRSGFYNNTIFHRVIAGFMIQGGGLDSEMKQNLPVNLLKTKPKMQNPISVVQSRWHVRWIHILQLLNSLLMWQIMLF